MHLNKKKKNQNSGSLTSSSPSYFYGTVNSMEWLTQKDTSTEYF